MKELLYKKSEAVAALNRVDGFHPMELARKIGEEGQEEQLYLDVKYRKLWFRLVNPAGKIISRIITFTENMAVVEARIYLDKCDQEYILFHIDIQFSMRLSTKRAVIIVSPPLSEMQHLHHIQYSIIKPRHIIIHPGLFLLSPAEKSSLRGSSLTSHRHCFL